MSKPLPKHIAIIMDGNGRWATQQGLARTEGHKVGARKVGDIVRECRKLGVEHLTLYTFSQENWKRPATEVATLFSLLVDFLTKEVPNMLEQDISLRVFGEVQDLPFAAREALKHGIRKTAKSPDDPAKMYLNLALNYGSRQEILRAIRQIVTDKVPLEDINEDSFCARLYSQGQPDPDLIIRTSGETRISNFLLFQCAYSEFYFCDTLWPDFTVQDLYKALDDYNNRNRRFGKTQEQIA